MYSDTGADVCVGEFRTYGPDPAAAGLDFGADLSFTPQELAAGAKFTYHGQQQSPVQIMRENGANYVRMRLWVDPPPGYSDLASDLALARSVHAAGMKIYLDIMYSDFWADPTKQNIPAAWTGQDLAQLTTTVQSYTEQVISAFARQGTPVDMVSIGNEIRNGILWPVGEVNDPTNPADYDNLATLLKAGVAGARAGNPPGHQLLIMMHYDQGGNNALSQAFYQNLVAQGVPFDVIGLSYYPFFHGPISAMRQNVDALAPSSTEIVISETQYPWTLANGNSPTGTAPATSSGSRASCRRATRPARAASCPSSPTSCPSWPRCRTGWAPGCSTGRRTGSPACRGNPAPASARRTPTSPCSTRRGWRCRRSGCSATRPRSARAMTRGMCPA